MRFEYDDPSPIELIADGQSVVVRDRRLATQDVYPLSQTPLRFLLADHVDLMKDTNLVAVYADDVFVTVVVEEKNGMVGTSRLMIMFSAKDMQLKQWTVTDPQGYDTTVAVYNLDTSKRPDPEHVQDRLHELPQLTLQLVPARGSCRASTPHADQIGGRLDALHSDVRSHVELMLRPCPSRSPPGTSIRSACASIWSPSS